MVEHQSLICRPTPSFASTRAVGAFSAHRLKRPPPCRLARALQLYQDLVLLDQPADDLEALDQSNQTSTLNDIILQRSHDTFRLPSSVPPAGTYTAPHRPTDHQTCFSTRSLCKNAVMRPHCYPKITLPGAPPALSRETAVHSMLPLRPPIGLSLDQSLRAYGNLGGLDIRGLQGGNLDQGAVPCATPLLRASELQEGGQGVREL